MSRKNQKSGRGSFAPKTTKTVAKKSPKAKKAVFGHRQRVNGMTAKDTTFAMFIRDPSVAVDTIAAKLGSGVSENAIRGWLSAWRNYSPQRTDDQNSVPKNSRTKETFKKLSAIAREHNGSRPAAKPVKTVKKAAKRRVKQSRAA